VVCARFIGGHIVVDDICCHGQQLMWLETRRTRLAPREDEGAQHELNLRNPQIVPARMGPIGRMRAHGPLLLALNNKRNSARDG
jgi:hypothetical protein